MEEGNFAGKLYGVPDLRKRRDAEKRRGRGAAAHGDRTMTRLHASAAAMLTLVIVHVLFPAQAREFYEHAEGVVGFWRGP